MGMVSLYFYKKKKIQRLIMMPMRPEDRHHGIISFAPETVFRNKPFSIMCDYLFLTDVILWLYTNDNNTNRSSGCDFKYIKICTFLCRML